MKVYTRKQNTHAHTLTTQHALCGLGNKVTVIHSVVTVDNIEHTLWSNVNKRKGCDGFGRPIMVNKIIGYLLDYYYPAY